MLRYIKKKIIAYVKYVFLINTAFYGLMFKKFSVILKRSC